MIKDCKLCKLNFDSARKKTQKNMQISLFQGSYEKTKPIIVAYL